MKTPVTHEVKQGRPLVSCKLGRRVLGLYLDPRSWLVLMPSALHFVEAGNQYRIKGMCQRTTIEIDAIVNSSLLLERRIISPT